MTLLEDLKNRIRNRPTLILKEPLVNFQGQGFRGIDSGVDELIKAKQTEWRNQGFTEHQIRMATDMATEWANSMSQAFAPPELRDTAFKYSLNKGFEVASKWLEGITK